jgi:hypothetical protein
MKKCHNLIHWFFCFLYKFIITEPVSQHTECPSWQLTVDTKWWRGCHPYLQNSVFLYQYTIQYLLLFYTYYEHVLIIEYSNSFVLSRPSTPLRVSHLQPKHYPHLRTDYISYGLFLPMRQRLRSQIYKRENKEYSVLDRTIEWRHPVAKQKVLGRSNRLLSLIRHGPHWKRRVRFFYCCVCIRYRGNVSTEPLPSNDRGIFTEPLLTKDGGGIHRHTQQRDLKVKVISLLYFSKQGK